MSRPSIFHASNNGGGGAQRNAGGDNNDASTEKTYFEVQREGLMREIGVSMESVLQNINKLNRSLEGIISVGNEFSYVEALWSHFENVMAPKDDGGSGEAAASVDAEAGEAVGHEEIEDVSAR